MCTFDTSYDPILGLYWLTPSFLVLLPSFFSYHSIVVYTDALSEGSLSPIRFTVVYGYHVCVYKITYYNFFIVVFAITTSTTQQ